MFTGYDDTGIDSLIQTVNEMLSVEERLKQSLGALNNQSQAKKAEVWEILQIVNAFIEETNIVLNALPNDKIDEKFDTAPITKTKELKDKISQVRRNLIQISNLEERINDKFDTFYKMAPNFTPIHNKPYDAKVRRDTTEEGGLQLPPQEAIKFKKQALLDYRQQTQAMNEISAIVRAIPAYPERNAYNAVTTRVNRELSKARSNIDTMFRMGMRETTPSFYDGYTNIYNTLKSMVKSLSSITPREH